ncbi:MAG: hypothetical protein ABI477_14050, partial [Chryseolinea sp.]
TEGQYGLPYAFCQNGNGWAVLGKLGFEPVRMVAIDEDWSALRFRKTSHIKTMTRSSAISDAGKKRIAEPKKKKP